MHVYSTTATAQPDAPDTYLHPVLKPMRAVTERLFDAGEFEKGFALLHAIAVLNGKPSFLRGSAHQHFPSDREGQAVQL